MQRIKTIGLDIAKSGFQAHGLIAAGEVVIRPRAGGSEILKAEGEMSRNEKSTDPGIAVAARKALRSREAEEAIADHERAQKAFHENRERLRQARLAQEAAAGPMLFPAPELPDDTPVESVRFSTRIRNALNAAGIKTIGEIRETSDDNLLSFPDLGPGSIAYLRQTLGLPSADGVRQMSKKPT